VKGCGYEGERSVTEGEGKLVWKCEFAARWSALDIRFEAYGKDIADSVRVNDWIAENVLKRPPPHHAKYELFQDKSGGKISKSVGNVLTPQDWLTYASPDSLRLLMFKRIVGARNLSIEDIPTYMDEFDELEGYYFSKTRDSNTLKDARLRGLYEYTVLTKVPDRPGVHLPYRQLASLAAMAPEGHVEEFVTKRLIQNGAIQTSSPDLSRRISWAAIWARDTKYAAESGDPAQTAEVSAPSLDPATTEAVMMFALGLDKSKSADDIQALAFESIRSGGAKPADFFSAVYRILLGSERGPRLGPYIIDAGLDATAQKLRAALERKS